jgi:CubicO group peptidase (beta-lactamase class C family)
MPDTHHSTWKTLPAVAGIALSMVLTVQPAAAQRAATGLPATTTPESVGLNSARLKKVVEMLAAETKAGTLAGATILVGKQGKIALFETVGELDPTKKTPMTRDAIFRIYSMTKPITSVAAMMLVEDGKLLLADPVAKYIPEFADVKVGVEQKAPDGKVTLALEPPRRAMTVQDLLRHTSGLTYGFFGTGLVKKAYVDSGFLSKDQTNEELSKALAKQPLMHQPGSNWEYSHATDVLGRVIEVASGQTLYAFMKARILDPLGMKDTSFYVKDAKDFPRIAEPHPTDRNFGPGADLFDPRLPIKYESGGGGMMSTTTDYARFLQMLINGGTLDGKRILSPATIRYMTSDHTAGMGLGSAYLPGDGYGFGLGFQVRRDDGMSPIPGTKGDYAWGGAAGTAFWVDPERKMYVIMMMQAPKNRTPIRTKLRDMIYSAVDK